MVWHLGLKNTDCTKRSISSAMSASERPLSSGTGMTTGGHRCVLHTNLPSGRGGFWLLDDINACLVDMVVGVEGLEGERWDHLALEPSTTVDPEHRLRADRGGRTPWGGRPRRKSSGIDFPNTGQEYIIWELEFSGNNDSGLFFVETGHRSSILHLVAQAWAPRATVRLLDIVPEGALELLDGHGDIPALTSIRSSPVDDTSVLLVERTPLPALIAPALLWKFFDVECTCAVRLSIVKRTSGLMEDTPEEYWAGRSNPFHSFLRRAHCEGRERGCDHCAEGLQLCLETLPCTWLCLKNASGCTPLHEAVLMRKGRALELLCPHAPEEVFAIEGPLQESALTPTSGSLLEAAVRTHSEEMTMSLLLSHVPKEVRQRLTSNGMTLLELYDSMHSDADTGSIRSALQPVVKSAHY